MKTKSFMKGAFIASILTAGAAFFVNKKVSSKTKAQAKKTVTDLTAKILTRMRELKRMSKENFNTVVEAAVDEYQAGKKMSAQTAREVKKELKAQWKNIERELKGKSGKKKK